MLVDFFRWAGRSPSRNRTFRLLVVMHLVVLGATVLLVMLSRQSRVFSIVGFAHLLLGIVEGALVIGWRLVQWPKSQSLEPLLLANISSRAVMAGEQAVGLAQMALIALSGVPLLCLLAGLGWMDPVGVLLLPVQGFLWGSAVGFGLVAWAYEVASVRLWAERILGTMLATYFVIGGLAGEHTLGLLRSIPFVGTGIVEAIWTFHHGHPFAVLHRIDDRDPGALMSLLIVDAVAIMIILLSLFRSAARLEPHYVDRHYRPISEQATGRRGQMGDDPLSWWAVRRVAEYAGRVNLYLAGGASILYAAYLVLGPAWPTWLGNRVFLVFEMNGGVATMTTILIVLAAVPAAYQYGLWDSSKTDRCRRLETLLTTDLNGIDFGRASWSASWARGRGYFYSAIILWLAAGISGRMDGLQILAAMGSAWLLLIIYFSIGFRQLAVHGGGTTTGFVLCVVIPLAVWGLVRMGAESYARLLPPGMIYFAISQPVKPMQVALVMILFLAAGVGFWRMTLGRFDLNIRRSFEADLLRGPS
ncbi:hypothetical protein K2X85_13485 [bacterium]|nr:hypothetical protein [bacterium]